MVTFSKYIALSLKLKAYFKSLGILGFDLSPSTANSLKDKF